jgi:hypothetical protein|nr:MAG TPA: hypothetical protein [Caudoviricetes sp.]
MGFFNRELLYDVEFRKELKKERDETLIRERKQQLSEERAKYRKKIRKPSTSKLLLVAAFLISFEILIFCEIAYFYNPDPMILTTLIGVPVTVVPIALGYLRKSMAENTADGIVYEMAMADRADKNEVTGYGD